MITKRALLPLALFLSACAAKPQAPQPIQALAESHRCPAYPLPPADLLKPPAKTLPQSDRLIATEQAIQLDELIKWVKAQAVIDPNESPR